MRLVAPGLEGRAGERSSATASELGLATTEASSGEGDVGALADPLSLLSSDQAITFSGQERQSASISTHL